MSLRRHNLPSKVRLRNNELHGTSTADATKMRYFQTELFSRFLPSPYASYVNLAAGWHWAFMQSSEMATKLNSYWLLVL